MKKEYKDQRVALFFMMAAFVGNLVYALTICSKCGHEVAEGAAACGHCKAAIVVKAQAPEPEPVAVVVDNSVAEMAAGFVEKQYKLAEQQESNPSLAFAIYQNAFAVLRLVPADERSIRIGKTLMQKIGQSRKELMIGSVPCRMCSGTGKYKVDLGKVDGSKNVKFVEGIQCKRCNGMGSRREFLSVDRIKMAVLKGRQSFEQQAMVAGDVKLGRVYLSAELGEKLDLEQRVLVMTGMPSPCKECQFTGLALCRGCKGTKWEKCPSENCKAGVIEEAAGTAKSYMKKKRLNGEISESCGRCEGSGEIPCRICQGKGGVICAKCGGTGEAPRCARCSGIGLITCTKCSGSGKVKDAECSKCAGQGKFLCTSCNGEGSVSK